MSNRAPIVCGALGSYDRERVLRIAAASERECRVVHQDERSILMLDREPLHWGGRRQRGLGWIEGEIWRGAAEDWEGAARIGACGLVLEGRRRFVHSSVNGIAPVYWIEGDGATYFASRIDPLVQAAPDKLSIDWDAWAAIVTLRHPLGEHTPFAEIRRLGPSGTLRRRLGRGRSRSHRWAWAEIEPSLDAEQGAEGAAEALREALAPLREGQVICPLSGGLDSRMLLSALPRSGAEITAITVSDDEGDRFEEDLAAPVAQALGVAQELLGASIEDYPADWEERARRVEHQLVDHAWQAPLARRIAGAGAPVTEGFALDTFMQTGARFHTPEVVSPPTPRQGNLALFDSVRRYGHAHHALALQFHEPLIERSRSQFAAAVESLEGHHSQPTVALYATRTVRGISTGPSGMLGRDAQVICPAVNDGVATAILSVASTEKTDRRLQTAIQRRLAAPLAGMPSTNDTPRRAPRLPRRWRSQPAAEMHRDLLGDGPLAPYVSPNLREWLSDPQRGELSPDLRLGMEAVSLLHSWWRRYRDRLREVDPADLLG